MSFRVLNSNPQFLQLSGAVLTVLGGGSLSFYVNRTTTPQNTYSDKALTIPNTNPVVLDAEGRSLTDIWGDGTYTVVLKDALGAIIWTRDDVQANSEIPDQAGNAGFYLTTDGATPSWGAISQVPSVTGNDNTTLITDGVTVSWGVPSLAAGAGATIADFVTMNIREKSQSVTATATTNFDYALGGFVDLAQAVAIGSITFTNLPVAGQVAIFTIRRTKDATATARTIAWPAAILWPGNVDPTLTQTTGGRDLFTIVTNDAGVTWDGSYTVAMA
jgi:hypothetical protein